MRHRHSVAAQALRRAVAASATALALLSCVGGASATVYYVKPNGNNGHAGTSWATAKLTIQAAINLATVPGDEVWVAAGTYGEQLQMPKSNRIYGGFAGTEVARNERNWHVNETVVDARGIGRPVTFLSGSDSTAGIDGFTLVGGDVPSGSFTAQGGAIWGAGEAVIANNRIWGNIATDGGGIFWGWGGYPQIVGNTIIGNAARNSGGGVFIRATYAKVANNVVAFNSAVGQGSALHADSVLATNNTIVGNGCTGPTYSAVWVDAGVVNRLSNNIIALNSSGIGVRAGVNKPSMTRNCVYANLRFDYSNVTPTDSNISADPEFADWYMGDFHLLPHSPCIDMGDDTRVLAGWPDLDGEARTIGAHVDIGADEHSLTPVAPPVVRVVHVSPFGSDSNDGRTWAQACRTIGGGIAAARGGDHIWVAQGIYPERPFLVRPMSLYGGFAGGETSVHQRNPLAYPTIIDGESARTCVATQIITAMPTLVSGFAIQNGFTSDNLAGGIVCQGSPTIIGNVVRLCTGVLGGGIHNQGGAPIISNNIVMANVATGAGGGGINLWQSIGAWVQGNVVVGNRCLAASGGGIRASDGVAWLINNTVSDNVSDQVGSAGGIHLETTTGPFILANNIVAFNTSGIRDGGSGPEQLENNCVFGNLAYNYSGLVPGATDIALDPQFVNRPTGDYHVIGTSPCVDGGADAFAPAFWTDPEGHPRILAAHVDIGAYEKPTVLVWTVDRSGVPGLTTYLKAWLRGIPDGVMLSAKTVDFAVDGTPVGSAVTSGTGLAVVPWVVTSGADTRPIAAEFAGDATHGPGVGNATLHTVVLATSVTVADVTALLRESALITSTLRRTDTGGVIVGETLVTSIDGTEIGSGPTDAYGRLRISYAIPDGAGPGTRTITTAYVGSSGYQPSSGSGSLEVLPARTTIFTFARTSVRGTSTTLKGLLRSLPDYQPLEGRDMAFSVDGTLVGSASTVATGWAAFGWAVPLDETVGAHTLGADFAGDAWFAGATGSGTFNVI